MSGEPRLIIALDYPDASAALALVDRVDPATCAVKVGLQLFVTAGPSLVLDLQQRGFRVFLDLKFHDIPNTVAAACAAAADLGVWMLTLHAGGGAAMLRAARESLSRQGGDTRLLAVTVLTSSSEATLREIGVNDSVPAQVIRLGRLAMDAGMSGLVCSPLEARRLRDALGPEAWLVTPGIRWTDSESGIAGDDQHRTRTPREAFLEGSSHIVVGRPVTRATDPDAAVRRILQEIPPPA